MKNLNDNINKYYDYRKLAMMFGILYFAVAVFTTIYFTLTNDFKLYYVFAIVIAIQFAIFVWQLYTLYQINVYDISLPKFRHTIFVTAISFACLSIVNSLFNLYINFKLNNIKNLTWL